MQKEWKGREREEKREEKLGKELEGLREQLGEVVRLNRELQESLDRERTYGAGKEEERRAERSGDGVKMSRAQRMRRSPTKHTKPSSP